MHLFQELVQKIQSFLCPKEIEIFIRMEKLFHYLEFCDLNKLDKIEKEEIKYDEVAESAKLYFQSNLGTVKIELIRYYNNIFHMSYANYAGSTVFELRCGRYWVEVIPMLGDILKAKDVDLAIYELEQYLYNNLGAVDDLETKYNNILLEKKKRHEKELELLEK